MNIGLVNLGCANNIIDSESVLGMLECSGQTIVTDPSEADAIIVNTCGLMQTNHADSLNNVVSLTGYPAKLIVIGCFKHDEIASLKALVPGVDLWVPSSDYASLHEQINNLFPKGTLELCKFNQFHRVLSTPKYRAYLQVSSSCLHKLIDEKDKYVHDVRPLDEVLFEANELVAHGVKEVMLVGTSLFLNTNSNKFQPLLDGLSKINGLESIRLPELNPLKIDKSLICYVARNPKVASSFMFDLTLNEYTSLADEDMKIVLAKLHNLINLIRYKIPDATIQARIQVSNPHKLSQKEFLKRLSALRILKFDHLHIEENSEPLSEEELKVSKERFKQIMNLHRKIAYRLNKLRIGQTFRGVVNSYDKKSDYFGLYSDWNTDETSGLVTFKSDHVLRQGQVVTVKITNAYIDGLHGEHIKLC